MSDGSAGSYTTDMGCDKCGHPIAGHVLSSPMFAYSELGWLTCSECPCWSTWSAEASHTEAEVESLLSLWAALTGGKVPEHSWDPSTT